MNGMNYEKIKSVILAILVIASIFLTWGLWTYQPEYNFIENPEYIQSVSVGNAKVDASVIIRPSKIMVHKNGTHYGITESLEISNFMKEVEKWSFDEFVNISSNIPREEFLSFLQQKGRVEIIYPDDFPVEVYRNIFEIEDSDIEGVSFDRIVIPIEKKEDSVVYFVSTEELKVYKATANNFNLQEITNIYNRAGLYPHYITYDISQTKALYIPKGSVTMKRLQYYTDELDVDKFKEVLFGNPSFVKQDLLAFREEFTDGSRLMDVNYIQRKLSYINPAAQKTVGGTDPTIIQKSIDFVNEHGGWTDTYYFAGWNEKNRKVIFRLMTNNYPVFNEFGMSEVVQEWGDMEIVEYQRPIFRLEIADQTSIPVEMLPGEEIIEYLRNAKNLDMDLVEDIVLGYELVRDAEREKVVILEPRWFCKYAGIWRKIVFKDEGELGGGNVIGLE